MKAEKMKSNIYIIYSISNSPYQEWQADLLDYSFKKVKQPGTLIRLCSEDWKYPKRKTPLSKEGVTIRTPNFSKLTSKINWPVMNKTGSLKYIFKNKKLQDEDTLIFLDPDMIFIKTWNPEVKKGTAYGQEWKGYSNSSCQKAAVQPELCPADKKECLMYPFAIKAGDMKNLVDDIEQFSRKGYLKCNGWMADMAAFTTAMVKNKISAETRENIGLCNNWDNHNDEAAPIMHYCQRIKDKFGEVIWNKWTYKPWELPPDFSQATNKVDREVLKTLQEFILSMTWPL